MAKNTGVQYEHLVRNIFDRIVNQHSATTIRVQRDIVLRGKTTTHQIDVYWEFEVGGIKYSTVVQAKDWTQPVNQAELIKFKGVLDDIPGQPKGVFVTKTGFQSGARELADKSGILIYELRKASEDDLKHRIKTLVIRLVGCVPHSTGFNLVVDDEWFEHERTRLNTAPSETFTVQISGMPNEIIFTDTNGDRLVDAQEIIRSFYPPNYQEFAPVAKTYNFDCDAFIATNNAKFPKVKVKGVQATVSVSRIDEEIQIGGEDIVCFILRNVVDASERLFDKDTNPLK
jgi:hypothetical protein